MNIDRRLVHTLVVAALAASVGIAAAQPFPSRAVTIVVPFPAGGVTDVAARLVARKLAEELRQPVVVDNRPGAGASIGAAAVAKAAPDGHTLLLGTLANMVVNSYVYKESLTYHPQRDFEPVHGVMALPLVIVTRADRPYKTLKDVVEAARARPAAISFATAGNGTVSHLAAELFQADTRTRLIHVPYKGSAPAITDLLAGVVDLAFDYAPTTEPHIKAGRLTALAVTGPRRLPGLPGVPTMTEAGYAAAEVTSWIGIFAPAAVPAANVAVLDAALARVLKDPEVTSGFTAAGGAALPLGSAELRALHDAEMRRWKPIVEKADIKPN